MAIIQDWGKKLGYDYERALVVARQR